VSTGILFPVLLFFIVISKGSVCLPAPRRFRDPVRENAPPTDKPFLLLLIVTYEFNFDFVEPCLGRIGIACQSQTLARLQFNSTTTGTE
jgi:hypothetical protein